MSNLVTYKDLNVKYGIGYETLRSWGNAGLLGPRVKVSSRDHVYEEHLADEGIALARAMDGRKKLTDADVIDMCRRWEAGETLTDLGQMFGVHFSYVSKIVNGKARANVHA